MSADSPTPNLPTWFSRALCADTGDCGLFPGHNERVDPAVIAMCARCPVSADCLAYATSNHETAGIWGGVDFRKDSNAARKRRVA